MRVIGLISGTSMDAIDAAVVDLAREGEKLQAQLKTFVALPYPPSTRAALDAVLDKACSAATLASLDVAVGEAFAAAANLALEESDTGADLIGSHGQTLCHQPRPDAASGLYASTLQIGEPAVIAQRTGLTTIADFRVADVACGGQGAPLVSFVDYALLRSSTESRAALNIGGIANLTLLPAGCDASQVIAFDTGPGNMLIDLAVTMLFPDGAGYDRNGQIAARGKANDALLAWLLANDFFGRRPPKTAGREQFGPAFLTKVMEKARALGCAPEDIVATLTELTGRTIADALPSGYQRIIAAGGGVHNRAIIGVLQRNLSHRDPAPGLVTADEFGLPVDAKEAMAFAVLAYETIHGRPGNLPHATGATRAVVLGKIVPGANFSALMRSVWGGA